MRTNYSRHARTLTALMLAALAAVLTSCGGSGVTTTGGTTTPPPGSTAGTITLSLVDSAGNAVTSISSGSAAIVRATLTDGNGAIVQNAVVSFATDANVGTITPSTALTNLSGVASVTLSQASITATGAATITATALVGTTTVTGSTNYTIGTSSLTMSAISLGTGDTAATALSAFGTTSVSVLICSGSGTGSGGCTTGSPVSTPQTVTFSSTCAGSTPALASLSSSVTTVNGVATASYRDMGCGAVSPDSITASMGSLPPRTKTIYINAATAGSIQFVSVNPAIISLAGTGGTSSSQVAFKVVDGVGNPISNKTVTFDLSTTLGGITLTPSAPSTAVSDIDGLVVTTVNAGIISTPVRVTASTCTNSTSPCTGTILSTQSNQLTVTTGIPAQSSFSLSASTLNIEGWQYDGETTTLTVRLADHFSNLPPDGTAVNFIAEGARVVGSCTTSNGDCSVTFNSQEIRPADGRVTVLAYAVGEESFIDTNGNGVADKVPGGSFGPELIDILGASTDKPEAWVDYDEDSVRDNTEPFIDFNNNGAYDAADGDYNGVLCDNIATSSAGTCSATKTIHVRDSIVIVLSGSTPVFSTDVATLPTYNPLTGDLDLGHCGGPQTIQVRIVDVNGNLMPAGTTVDFAANGDGTVTSTGGHFPVENANTPIALIPTYNYSVTIKGDGSLSGTPVVCTDSTANGDLTVTVTTPNGDATTITIANLIN